MRTLFRFVAPPSPCGYLPEQRWSLEYEQVVEMEPAEYLVRMQQGWRRFGDMLFRPRCRHCSACRSLRVLVEQFRPNRSQRRLRKANAGVIRLEIGPPSVSREKLDLYDRYHAHRSVTKGWPWHDPKDADEYRRSFVANPFPTMEWRYYLDQRLVGVGYVDDLPGALSAIYFVHEPAEAKRALGIWNILCLIEHAAARKIPHVYLGYYVVGCPSMSYKANFVPNEILEADGRWRLFRP